MPYVLATCSLSAYHIWSVFLLFIISLTSYLTLKISGAWKLDCAPHVWKLGYDFLFALHSNYGPILYHFRDKEWYRSKIAIFHTQPAFDATVRRSPSEYCRMVWCGKTRNTTVKTVWEYDYSFRHNTRTWRTDTARRPSCSRVAMIALFFHWAQAAPTWCRNRSLCSSAFIGPAPSCNTT